MQTLKVEDLAYTEGILLLCGLQDFEGSELCLKLICDASCKKDSNPSAAVSITRGIYGTKALDFWWKGTM